MSLILKHLQSYTDRYLSTKIVFMVDILVSVLASLLSMLLIHILTQYPMVRVDTILWIV